VNVQPRPVNEFEGFYRQPLILTASGSFTEIVRLIHQLRHRETFLTTEAVNIRIEEDDERNPVLRMELTLYTLLAEELMPMSEITRIIADTTTTGAVSESEPGDPGGGAGPGEGTP